MQKLENQQNVIFSMIFNDLEMAFKLIRKFVEVYFLRTTDQCSIKVTFSARFLTIVPALQSILECIVLFWQLSHIIITRGLPK